MNINNSLTLEQKQLLSQTQIQSLRLLNMCNTELSSFLNNEYLENPLLEHTGGDGAPGMTEEFESWYYRNQNFNEGYGHGDSNETDFREAVPVEDEKILKQYLKEQLNAGRIPKKNGI